MNIAVIFAGGTGQRMRTKDKPKQFLLVHGKPIIVHTVEIFQEHSMIDAIVIVCVESWIDHMKDLVWRYRLNKVRDIIPGGDTGQMSIYNGLTAADSLCEGEDAVVLIHDGVRPLITAAEIALNVESVRKYGSAITCARTKETFVLVNENNCIQEVPDRSCSFVAKAPQSFWLKDILEAQRRAIAEGITDVIDSCTLMRIYGKELHYIEGLSENIKITSPEDFYIFRAIYDARENQQLE